MAFSLLDRLFQPEAARRQDENILAQTRQAQMDAQLREAQAKQIDQDIKQKDQIIKYLDKIDEQDPELGYQMRTNGKLVSLLMMLTRPAGMMQQPPTQTVEQTGEMFRPTESMVAEQGLPQMLSSQQLFGGADKGRLVQDMLLHELGYPMENPSAVAETRPMVNPQGKLEIGQITKGGRTRWTGQTPVPKYTWKTMPNPQNPQEVVDVPFDEMGQPNFDLAQSVPTDVTWVEGRDANGQPIRIPVPTKIGQGGAFGVQSPVRLESVPTEGPRGEKGLIQINPFGGRPSIGGASVAGGAPGIQTAPAKPTQIDVAAKTNLVKTGIKTLAQIKGLIFDPNTGKINRKNLANAMIGTPWTKGKQLGDLMFAAIDPIIRAATGAQINPSELTRYAKTYTPTYTATDDHIYQTWDTLLNFLNGYLQMLDPNEVYTKDVQESFKKAVDVKKTKLQEPNLVHFEVGIDEYWIPKEKVDAFKKKYPKAKRVGM